MKFSISRFLVPLVAITLFITQAHAQVVNIPDPNLESAIRQALELPDGTPISRQEILRLTTLKAEQREITDLTGLQFATNVTRLFLGGNQIFNLSPLSELSQLQHLSLWANSINSVLDLSPLSNLTEFRTLDITDSQLLDITPLANLTQLEWLSLAGTISIEDLSPLSNLTQLKFLRLTSNRIVNISPLANLVQLEELWLNDNRIVDIKPLASLAALEKLSIESNQVVDVSPLANLTQLTDLKIANNAITDFSPLFGLNIQSVDVDIHKLQELASGDVEIPDPNLERAIREEMGLPSGTPITQLLINQLTSLTAREKQIADLTGLEHASNLKHLALPENEIQDITPLTRLMHLEVLELRDNPIRDLTPLENLTNLTYINLAGVRLSDITALANLTRLKTASLSHMRLRDITPLANLTQLVRLNLVSNQIVDVSPLAALTTLEELHIERNNVTDISPLLNLSFTTFTYDQVCSLPDPPIQDRIENRNLPSIIQTWGDKAINLLHLSSEDRVAYYDLFWHHLPFGLRFQQTPPWSTLAGDIDTAIAEREELLAKNSNMIFLAELRLALAHMPGQYPEDWFGWLRDEDGNLVGLEPHSLFEDHEDHDDLHDSLYSVNFELPKVQDLLVQQAISVSQCGLYDGIYFDTGTEHPAILSILQRIRANVPDDFLIVCNRNRHKLPLSAPYMNGSFMETHPKNPAIGYTRDDIIEIETNLIWLEQNLREPQINCPRGHGIATEPPDSPNNRRWMRLFTTMSLTLSDGYVLYTTGHFYQEHFWHPFWDANLGQPVESTAQPYQNVEGLYLREFTNGWAVYNRSGQAQSITLPASAAPVSDRGNNAASQTHLLPDLDGEIYLTSKSFADVNGDGKVNILDLLQVANSLGQAAPDPNGDGVVNTLDLVFITQQFSQ